MAASRPLAAIRRYFGAEDEIDPDVAPKVFCWCC
jgi:hypothetical protein